MPAQNKQHWIWFAALYFSGVITLITIAALLKAAIGLL